jgi:hypothetical protein
MKNSLNILQELSDTIYSHKTYYTYNKTSEEDLTDKYRKGRINASKWLNELIWVYLEKEKKFIHEFKDHIKNEKEKLKNLPNTDFKKGIYDELNIIEGVINDKLNHNNK